MKMNESWFIFFFFQAEDGIRDYKVTGVQTCALPIFLRHFAKEDLQAVLKSVNRNEQNAMKTDRKSVV